MVVHSLQLLREGGNDENTRINNKKKRRLDKYIEAKLRKEEKARLLEKLAHSSADIRDRTELVSAATLGTVSAASARPSTPTASAMPSMVSARGDVPRVRLLFCVGRACHT